MISYEVSIGLIIINILLCVGSLNLTEIIAFQQKIWLIFPLESFISYVYGFSFRLKRIVPPFDLPEAES